MTKTPRDAPASRELNAWLASIADIDLQANEHGSFDPWPYASALYELENAFRDGGKSAVSDEMVKREYDSEIEYWVARESFAGPELLHPELKLKAAQDCLRLKVAIENGDGPSVLYAVANCAAHGIKMPGWLAAAFMARFERVVMGDCREWSDDLAFGRPHRGVNVASVRAREHLAPWAYEVACSLLAADPRRGIEPDFYAEIGQTVNRSHSAVFDLIRQHVTDSGGAVAPLQFIRDGLARGSELASVLRAWQSERQAKFYRSLGFVLGADGVWTNEL